MTNQHLIYRIQVTGGFLENIDIKFSNKLNCIKGARGTGKTRSLINWLPITLNQVELD